MKILDLYKDILSTGNLKADSEGNISAVMGESSLPFTVENKRLVLPTQQHLANPDWTHRVVFHPLSENVLRGESKVMEKFRGAINTRLNWVLSCLVTELMYLVTSVEMHKNVAPDKAELLAMVKGTDDKTIATLTSLRKAMGLGQPDKSFVNIFIKRGGTVNGKRYSRAAIVHFPLYEELKKKEKTVFGVTMNAGNRAALISLLEFMIPGIDRPGHFDRGSESDISPSLDALMRGLLGLAECINTTVNNYEKFITDPDAYLYSDEWVSVFDNLAQMIPEIRAIPMQAGNEGQVEGAHKPAQATPGFTQQPLQVAAPAAINMANFHPPTVPVCVPVQYQQPVEPPKTASGGLDFVALLREKPQLAAAVGAYGYNNNQPQMSGPAALRNSPQVNNWQQPQVNNWQQPQGYNQPQGFGRPQSGGGGFV